MQTPNESTQVTSASQHASEVEDFDVVIVGGAMAGATLALALSELNQTAPIQVEKSQSEQSQSEKGQSKLPRQLRIALVESQVAGHQHPGFDARSIAIASGSIFQLQQLGIWPQLKHLGTPINNIHVSDRGHFGMTELLSDALDVPEFGQVVELAQVGQVLTQALEHQAAKQSKPLQLFCPASVATIQAEPDYHQLTLNTGQQLRAKLIVAADGAHSMVRQQFNQACQQVDFGQSAIVANVVTDQPHQGWAYERFTEHGPIALLPMANSEGRNRLSLVWAMQPQQVERVKALAKPEFLAELQQAFGHRCGRFIDVGSVVSYPLTLSYMPRPFFHRCVFVGNAAQTLHPIAGQGFNLGLRDIAQLVSTIKQAIEQDPQTDVGAAQYLHQYYQARQSDRDSTINNIEFLVRGFSNQHWPLVTGRNLGLRLLSWLPPLKRPVAEVAMGWR